jgi:hypothetical protein
MEMKQWNINAGTRRKKCNRHYLQANLLARRKLSHTHGEPADGVYYLHRNIL